jgi:hypothetical protein
MLSVLVAFRNTRDRATLLLQSLLRTFGGWPATAIEFLFIDDASDPQQQIPALFADFRAQLPAGMKATDFLFKQHQHYTRGLAYGFSAAKGDNVLFVSHDMVVTSDYVRMLLAVAALDARIGLVRGVSPYVDSFPQHCVAAPFQLRTVGDIDRFARYVSDYWELHHVEDRLLTGDSMLVKRSVLEKIGTFDPRYFGYFGDIDFGLRLQRAGFKMVCAKGAWLFHEGAAAYFSQARSQEHFNEIQRKRMQTVNDAYRLFRNKWDRSLPPDFISTDALPLERLRVGPPPTGGDVQPFITVDPSICTVR